MTDNTATVKATRVTNEDVKGAITDVQVRLGLLGIDATGWRLVNLPGEGFLILNVSGGFPAETGNRQDTIALCKVWTSVLDLFIAREDAARGSQGVAEATESVKAAPVKAGAKKVAPTV